MHVGRPIRFPEDHPDALTGRPQARSGLMLVAVLVAVFAAVASVALAADGAPPPCGGQEFALSCSLG
jgi:hypothetical protein